MRLAPFLRPGVDAAGGGADLVVGQERDLRKRRLGAVEAGDFGAVAAHPGAVADKNAAVGDTVRRVVERAADDRGEAEPGIVGERDLRKLGAEFTLGGGAPPS